MPEEVSDEDEDDDNEEFSDQGEGLVSPSKNYLKINSDILNPITL